MKQFVENKDLIQKEGSARWHFSRGIGTSGFILSGGIVPPGVFYLEGQSLQVCLIRRESLSMVRFILRDSPSIITFPYWYLKMYHQSKVPQNTNTNTKVVDSMRLP